MGDKAQVDNAENVKKFWASNLKFFKICFVQSK